MTSSFDADERRETLLIIAGGFLAALVFNLPFFSYLYHYNWDWAQSFPLNLLGICLSYLKIFFHELGHTLTGWFYGYFTLPAFDFQHGGGMSWRFSDQSRVLNIFLYCVLTYLFFLWRGHRALRILCVVLALFHLATAYSDIHDAVISFAGPFAEAGVAAFLITRAWFNLAPRGLLERCLNAIFGFALAFQVLIEGWALLHDDVVRQVYFEQKGQHGMGDFDRIANAIDGGFSLSVSFWMILAAGGIILPALLYTRFRRPEPV